LLGERRVSRLRSQGPRSLLHSLADAYGAESRNAVSLEAFKASEISEEDWSRFLGLGASQG